MEFSEFSLFNEKLHFNFNIHSLKLILKRLMMANLNHIWSGFFQSERQMILISLTFDADLTV